MPLHTIPVALLLICFSTSSVVSDLPDESIWLPIASNESALNESLLRQIRVNGNAVLSEPSRGGPLRSGNSSAFTVIGLPDTQHYSELYPEIFLDQTQWVVSQRYLRDIRYVNHYGDVVQHADIVSEWENGDAAMSVLDVDGLPYGINAGNHGLTANGYEAKISRSCFQHGWAAESGVTHCWCSLTHVAVTVAVTVVVTVVVNVVVNVVINVVINGFDALSHLSRRQRVDDVLHDFVGGDAFGFAFEVEETSMSQSGEGDSFDVIRRDMVASIEHGHDLAAEDECLRGTRARAEAEEAVHDRWRELTFGVCREDHADCEVLDLLFDSDGAYRGLVCPDLFTVEYGRDLRFVAGGGAVEDLREFFAGRVADLQLEEETVELCFRKRVGAFLFDRVLRGHHEEGTVQLMSGSSDRHRMFLHRFEQGGLRLRGCSIDFVRQNDL